MIQQISCNQYRVQVCVDINKQSVNAMQCTTFYTYSSDSSSYAITSCLENNFCCHDMTLVSLPRMAVIRRDAAKGWGGCEVREEVK